MATSQHHQRKGHIMTITETHTSTAANTMVVNYLGENWTPNLDNATERLIANTVAGIADLEEQAIDYAHRAINDMEHLIETITTKGRMTGRSGWSDQIVTIAEQRNLNLSFLNCILHAYVQDN
jgi:hypothetical protein